MEVNHLVKISSWVCSDSRNHKVIGILWNGSCRWFLHWLFFFIHDRVSHYLSKTRNIYFLLEIRHKFGFSFLKGKKQTTLDWHHSTFCCVRFESFYGPIYISCSSNLLFWSPLSASTTDYLGLFTFTGICQILGKSPVLNIMVKSLYTAERFSHP